MPGQKWPGKLVLRGNMEDWIKNLHQVTGGNDFNQDVNDWLGTGFLPLNRAMSGKYDGGFPVGRISEVYGGPSSGKTLLATMAMIETQNKGGLAVFLDFEHAFSISRGQELGLRIEPQHWLFKQPTTAEDGMGIVEMVCGAVDAKGSKKHVTIVVDSVAAMVTKEELEAGFDGANMRTKLSLAACMSASLKKVVGVVSKHNVTLIFLNQIRLKPNVMFGDNESTSGGEALKFYASLRMKLTKGAKVKESADPKAEIIGEIIRANMVKNKVYRPFQTTEWTSDFTYGIELDVSHINALIEMGKLEKNSSGRIELDGKKLTIKQLSQKMKDEKETRAKIIRGFLDDTLVKPKPEPAGKVAEAGKG